MRAFWANSTATRLGLPGSGSFGYPGLAPAPKYWPGRNLPKPAKTAPSITFGPVSAQEKPTGGKRHPRLMALEALLFASVEPLTLESLAVSLNLGKEDVEPLLDELALLLNGEESALTLQRHAGGYQLATRPEFHTWLLRAGMASEPQSLAEPLAEALAVVAYRQPVTRAEIDELRGGPSADLIRQLLERRLIRLAGRQKTLGRPAIYRTTRQFLEWTGVNQLSDLPQVDGIQRRESSPTSAPPT